METQRTISVLSKIIQVREDGGLDNSGSIQEEKLMDLSIFRQ